jgi:hypothetical protein
MLYLFENPIGKTEHQIVKEQMEQPRRGQQNRRAA